MSSIVKCINKSYEPDQRIEMYVFIYTIVFISCAIICHLIEKRGNANAVFWGVLGAVFGRLAIPFVFLSKPGDNNGD